VGKIKAHPGIARAQAYLEKAMILAPKQEWAATTLYSLHEFTRNESALTALEKRIRAADLDTSDQFLHTKELLSGSRDQQTRTTLSVSLKRSQDLAEAVRGNGGRTAAVALDSIVEQMMALDMFTGTTDAAKVLSLAQEAHRLSPSRRTASLLTTAYLFQAAAELRHSTPAFDAMHVKYVRALGITHLMAFVASEPGPLGEQVTRMPQVQKAAELMRDMGRRLLDSGSPYEWALLKNVDATEAARIAQSFRTTPRKHTEQVISLMLQPSSAQEAMDMYWMANIDGKPEDGRLAVQRVAAMGIPTPIQQ
jgi:hypothetical protein